jgi:hypothetical protein
VTHLMLDPEVIAAVEAGQFHIHTAEHVLEGLALLTGQHASAEGSNASIPSEGVLTRAEHTLNGYRRACQEARPYGLGDRRPPTSV